MTTEEKIRYLEEKYKNRIHAIWIEGESLNDLMVAVDDLIIEQQSLLASEIIAEKIKLLEEIRDCHGKPIISIGIKLSELREEGKEKV